jgi:hypothetical protein
MIPRSGFSYINSLVVSALFGLSLLVSISGHADVSKNCHTGSYQLSDGQTLDVAPRRFPPLLFEFYWFAPRSGCSIVTCDSAYSLSRFN